HHQGPQHHPHRRRVLGDHPRLRLHRHRQPEARLADRLRRPVRRGRDVRHAVRGPRLQHRRHHGAVGPRLRPGPVRDVGRARPHGRLLRLQAAAGRLQQEARRRDRRPEVRGRLHDVLRQPAVLGRVPGEHLVLDRGPRHGGRAEQPDVHLQRPRHADPLRRARLA
ncbi:hypothetical protein LTR53_019023, partial [Teratosphaeriaceae sp. CCFEE 6253]